MAAAVTIVISRGGGCKQSSASVLGQLMAVSVLDKRATISVVVVVEEKEE